MTTLSLSDKALAPRREGGWDESFAIASDDSPVLGEGGEQGIANANTVSRQASARPRPDKLRIRPGLHQDLILTWDGMAPAVTPSKSQPISNGSEFFSFPFPSGKDKITK